MTTPPKVLFVLAEFPSYRQGVLAAIAGDPRLDARFFGAPEARVAGIETFDATSLGATIHGRNVRIGKLFWQRGAFTAIRRMRPDVVVFLGDAQVLSTWLLAAMCRMLRIRTLFWTIGWHRPERGLKRLVRLSFYRLANGLLLYGKQGYRYGSILGYPAKRMTIIGNSTGNPSATATPRAGAIRTAVVCVGRLTSVKRLDLVIRAAAMVKGITVELVGDGPERVALQELAADLGVDCVFHGESHDPALLGDVYARAICTVIPGAAGLSVTQSLAYGVPVITNNMQEDQMPEAEAVIDGVTGTLYEKGDVASLGKAIQHWRSMSETEWQGASEACLAEYRAHWTPAHHADLIVRAVTSDARSFAEAGDPAFTDYAAIKRIVFWQNAPSIHFAPVIRAMARSGYEVHVVTEFGLAGERRALGWDYPDFGEAHVYPSPPPPERRRLETDLGPESHHVFTGTGAYPQTFASLQRISRRCESRGRLCVVTEAWNPSDWKAPLRAVRYVLRSRAVPLAVDTVLAIGPLAVSQFSQTVRESVDVLPFIYSVEPSTPSFADNDGPIIFVGKLERRKRVDLLLRAYAGADGLTRPLTIVGDGPQRRELGVLAKQLGVSNRVNFVGARSNGAARQMMAGARALVLPSRFDGWGAVVNEALHAGCFVIASSGCGSSELLAEGRGIVIDDQSSLSAALLSLRETEPGTCRMHRSDWARTNIGPDAIASYLGDLIERRRGDTPRAPWLGPSNARLG